MINSTQLVNLQAYTCNQYSCDQCGVTDIYCRYCPDTDTCGRLAGRFSQCSFYNPNPPYTYECPRTFSNPHLSKEIPPIDNILFLEIFSMNVTQGSTDGGTLVSLFGSGLYIDNSVTPFQITFGSATGNISQVTATSMVVYSPQNPTTGPNPIGITYLGRNILINSINFRYYGTLLSNSYYTRSKCKLTL